MMKKKNWKLKRKELKRLKEKTIALALVAVIALSVIQLRFTTASAAAPAIIHNFPTNVMPEQEYFITPIALYGINWDINNRTQWTRAIARHQRTYQPWLLNPRDRDNLITTREDIRVLGNDRFASSQLLFSNSYEGLEDIFFTLNPRQLNFHTLNMSGFLFNGDVRTEGTGANRRLFYTGWALVLVGHSQGRRSPNEGSLRLVYAVDRPLGNPGRQANTFPAEGWQLGIPNDGGAPGYRINPQLRQGGTRLLFESAGQPRTVYPN